jgi:hypothetical protein
MVAMAAEVRANSGLGGHAHCLAIYANASKVFNRLALAKCR